MDSGSKGNYDGAIVVQGKSSHSDPLKNGRVESWGDNASGGGSSESSEGKRERIAKDNLQMCGNMFTYLLFLIIFTATMLASQSLSTSRLADHLRGKVNPASFPISTITDVNMLYRYLEEVLVPSLYENNTDTQMALEQSAALHPIDASNRMLGTVRLRQARVSIQEDCQVTPLFSQYKVACYPGFTESTQSMDPYGPELRFKYSDDSLGGAYTGQFNTYGPNGFMLLLGQNVTASIEQIRKLKVDGFMDAATRAVFAEFNIMNLNTGAYAVVKVVVEFSASGAVAQQVDIGTMTHRALKPGGLGSTSDWIAFSLMCLVMLFVLNFVIEEIQEFYEGWRTYFNDAWNILDWINNILLLTGFTMRLLLFSKAGGMSIGGEALANQESFQNLSALTESFALIRILNAFNCVLLWGKVVKYLRHLPVLKILINAVWNAFDLFIPFLIMFGVAFIGFVMAFNIGFGDKILEMSTFAKSAVYLCRAFVRDVKLMPVYDLTPIFGAGLIMIFYLTMLLVGLALMFAMMADSLFNAKYSKVLKEKADHAAYWHEDEPLEEFARWTKRKSWWLLKRYFPSLNDRIQKYRQSQEGQGEHEMDDFGHNSSGFGKAQGGLALQDRRPSVATKDSWRMGGGGGKRALEDDRQSSHSTGYSDDSEINHRPRPQDLMRAIEHMSGRILSEITVTGIEIKSELHDVCERVAQMQMAVEELTWRCDKVKGEQESQLQDDLHEF